MVNWVELCTHHPEAPPSGVRSPFYQWVPEASTNAGVVTDVRQEVETIQDRSSLRRL